MSRVSSRRSRQAALEVDAGRLVRTESRFITIGLLLTGVLASLGVTRCANAGELYKLSGTLDAGYYRGYDGKSQFGSISRSNVALDLGQQIDGDTRVTARLSDRFFLRDPQTGHALANEDPRYLGSGEASVGLTTAAGTLRVGRAMTAMRATDGAFDPWGNYDSIASPAWWLWHGSSPADPNASSLNASYPRLNDGVFYSSPGFGDGMSVHLSQGLRQQPGDARRSTSVALVANRADFSWMVGHERTPADHAIDFAAVKLTLGKLALMGALDHEALAPGGANRSATLAAQYRDAHFSYLLGYGRQVDYHANFFSAGLSCAYRPDIRLYLSYGYQGKGFWGSSAEASAIGIGAGYSF